MEAKATLSAKPPPFGPKLAAMGPRLSGSVKRRGTFEENGQLRKVIIALACACVPFAIDPFKAFPSPPSEADSAASPSDAAERYVLPITPPRDQGDSDLCWVYATLSMLETNYMYRHPESHLALSRGSLQVASIADRFLRVIDGEPIPLEEGGLAVEALGLIRRNGLLAESDFHDVVDSTPVYASLKQELAETAVISHKFEVLDDALADRLGVQPSLTHLDGRALTPEELAHIVLGSHQWIEFDLSRDGPDGWGPSRDPDARPETRVNYVKLDRMIDLIHWSLAHGRAVVAGSEDHAFLIYGADYDRDGNPLSYLIKDSLPPLTYRSSADDIHRMLNDVTVAF